MEDTFTLKIIPGLLAAFAGGMIALTYDKYKHARDLNRIRRAIKYTIDHTYIKKLAELKSININWIQFLRNPVSAFYDINEFDDDLMPMLNSDLIQSIAHEQLVAVTRSDEVYSALVMSNYVIDFIRQRPGREHAEEFRRLLHEHMRLKGIKSDEERYHLNTCSYAFHILDASVLYLEKKNSVIDSTIHNFSEVSDALKGPNFKWIVKYLF